MGVLAVLLAAAAGFATGAAWYMILGPRWMVAVGRSKDEIKADQNPLPFIIAFLASLLTAGMMRHVIATSGLEGIGAGFLTGLGTGLFMVAPWVLTNYAFAARPRNLWWIDAGHVALACTSIGTVLGLFA